MMISRPLFSPNALASGQTLAKTFIKLANTDLEKLKQLKVSPCSPSGVLAHNTAVFQNLGILAEYLPGPKGERLSQLLKFYLRAPHPTIWEAIIPLMEEILRSLTKPLLAEVRRRAEIIVSDPFAQEAVEIAAAAGVVGGLGLFASEEGCKPILSNGVSRHGGRDALQNPSDHD